MAKVPFSGSTAFKRFRDWVKADVFKRLFDAVSDEPDMECAMSAKPEVCAVDATVVKSRKSPCDFAVTGMAKGARAASRRRTAA